MFGYLGYVKYTSQPNHLEFISNPEERQIMEQALLAQELQMPFYSGALVGLGRQLTDWGERLQERFDSESEMSLN